MRRPFARATFVLPLLAIAAAPLVTAPLLTAPLRAAPEILNVSYDPTRELYQAINPLFARAWKAQSGEDITIRQSHGGSGKQARAVIDGLPADVVTLALGYDIDALSAAGLVRKGWQSRLPHNATPFTSPIVLLVRKGNPKHIRDWSDLARPDVKVITPNPKTSGGARWNFLAAFAYGTKTYGTGAGALDYITKLYRNVPVLDSGARGATTTFVERGQGDVLIAWENEALLTTRKLAPGRFEIVMPSVSILAEPPVAVVDKVVDTRHTRAVAEAYLNFLYTPAAQEIGAQNYYRPTNPALAQKYAGLFPKIALYTVDRNFHGWARTQALFFNDGGVFDQILAKAHQ